jgi:arylsulfatase A-like enzyme
VLAGCYGAAIVDAALTFLRADAKPGLGALLGLAMGLYGVAGTLLALVAEGASRGLLRVMGPAGWQRLRDQPAFDEVTTTGALAVVVGVGLTAVGVALGHVWFVADMASERLQTIALFGLVPLSALPATIAALSGLPLWRRLVQHLPWRPRLRVLLLGLLVAGALALVVALSRADWRVLDLGPFGALFAAAALGIPHAFFWYRTWRGQVQRASLPRHLRLGLAVGAGVLPFLLCLLASRLDVDDPVMAAVESSSLGLRKATAVARKLTDHDHDGFSARFGGGDCDDARADVYPGAEEIPGDGIDQNCEGGDPPAVEEVAETPPAEPEPDAKTPPKSPGAKGSAAGKAPAPVGPDGDAEGALAKLRKKGNFLFITIDALRGDRLGVAGYGRPSGHSLTPAMDGLASRGTYFRRVWSQAPNTPRSFPSILTGRYPSDVRWDKPGVNYPVVLPENHTFFEDLQTAGFRTIGIFSHFYFVPERGINQGFDEWSDDGAGTIAESNKDTASPRIVPRVIARLKQAAAKHERFALWTHLFEPHASYMTHKEFPTSGASGAAGLMEKYDYEIAFVDRWVGKLLNALGELGLADDTVVVLMADHGEAWGEHKMFFHGQDLFDEQLRIPLVMSVPGLPPHVVTSNVAAVDVAPTLLSLFGLPLSRSLRGESLLPALTGEDTPSHVIFSELMPATAWPHRAAMMVDGDNKLIHRISERRFELYTLARDPKEQKDQSHDPSQAATLQRLRTKLLAFEERRR